MIFQVPFFGVMVSTDTYKRSTQIPYTSPWRGPLDYDFVDFDNDGEVEIITSRMKHGYDGFHIDIVDRNSIG